MGDWPATVGFDPVAEFIDCRQRGMPYGSPSTMGPVANLAYLWPFRIFNPVTLVSMGWWNGSAVGGNVDAGIYDASGVRLGSTGAVAQATTGVRQKANLTSPYSIVDAGDYYLAISFSAATSLGIRGLTSGSANRSKRLGICEVAASHPLPTSLTLAVTTNASIPMVMAFTY